MVLLPNFFVGRKKIIHGISAICPRFFSTRLDLGQNTSFLDRHYLNQAAGSRPGDPAEAVLEAGSDNFGEFLSFVEKK
jgi:hypothetical protein